MVTASYICSLWRHLQGLPALSPLPERQESCTFQSAHSLQALCCFSNVQSSSCMLDHRHENGLHLSEHQHLNKTWWSWHCAVYCGIAFLSLSVRSAGTLILVSPKMYSFQSVLLEKSRAVMVWKKMHEKEQLLNANPFGCIFSPFTSFPSPEQKANTEQQGPQKQL